MASSSARDAPVPIGLLDASDDVLRGAVATERRYGVGADGKKKRILLNAFDMNGVGHISIGQWQNPEDHSPEKNRLPYWISLAKLLEKGKFNALFLADNFGSHDIYQGSHAPAIRAAAQWPLYDPFVIVSAMAAVTKTLAFGITSCTTFEPPFLLAKRFSTLDHITEGRVAWNIVTSWSDAAARANGYDALPAHEARYEKAEEYMDLVYKLWEGSWADGAVVQDASTTTYTDPAKVRAIAHAGTYFRCHSAHQVDPSPQRTPLLFQAGVSPAGASFAAKHAECVFTGGANTAIVQRNIERTRQLAVAQGRDPYAIKFFVSFTPVLAATEDEAASKAARYRQYGSLEGNLAQHAGISGIDLGRFPIDDEFPTDPSHPLYEGLSEGSKQRLLSRPAGIDRWTPRRIAEERYIGGAGVYKIGTGKTVADEMERWITEADIDGFNIGHVVVPGAWEDVIDYLLPELEARGWLGDGDYPVPGGTARENLYNTPGDAHLRTTHPGRKYRFVPGEATAKAELAAGVAVGCSLATNVCL